MTRLHRFAGARSGLRVLAIILVWAIGFATSGASSPTLAASKYASIVIDQNTGRVLYSRNADAPRYPASLTKIMTLYMLFARLQDGEINLDTRLKVSRFAASRPPSKVGLKPGQTIRVSDAIAALVTKSANDVATVIAENLGGTESKFARMMTVQAAELGMSKTTFRNASGLPNKAQKTSARDMAILSRRIMEDFPEYYGHFSRKYFKYRGKRFRNHNRLLFTYKGTDGVKTGYTRASGFNLAASVHRGKKHLVAVVMGGKTSKSRNRHMRALLDRSWKRASRWKRPTAAPRPRRNPRRTNPVPVASASPVHTATLAPSVAALPWAPGIGVDDRDPEEALRGVEPARVAPAPAAGRNDGGFHVQVGAYSSRSEALAQLDTVRERASKIVGGHSPITMPLPKPKRYLYRARFAGFSEAAARQACSQLKQRRIPCVVMRAE